MTTGSHLFFIHFYQYSSHFIELNLNSRRYDLAGYFRVRRIQFIESILFSALNSLNYINILKLRL